MSNLMSRSYREHVMLLYNSDDERNAAAADYINEGLAGGQLCVYASVGALDRNSKWHISCISPKIADYERNVRKGELVIVDFKPFFESAQKGDLTPFRQLKARLESMLVERIRAGRGDKVLVFADAACTLSENGEFDECVSLERWWQKAHDEWKESRRNVTVICPHPGAVLDNSAKNRVGAVHSLTLRLQHYIYNQAKEALRTSTKPMRVLIAEPNTDMRMLYRRYLDALGLEVAIAESGSECLKSVFSGGKAGFDLIILDSHLSDMPGLQVARRIKERLPDQKIVITTTSIVEDTSRNEIGIEEVMTKPFSFSKLLALIKPSTV